MSWQGRDYGVVTGMQGVLGTRGQGSLLDEPTALHCCSSTGRSLRREGTKHTGTGDSM